MAKSNQDYWKNRMDEIFEHLDRTDLDFFYELEKIYSKYAQTVQKEIYDFYVRFATDNSISLAEAKQRLRGTDLSDYVKNANDYRKSMEKDPDLLKLLNEQYEASKLNKLEFLESQMRYRILKMGDELEDSFTDYLKQTAKYVYDNIQLGGGLSTLSEHTLKQIIQRPWNGRNYSQAVWGNVNELTGELKKVFTEGFIRGLGPAQMARELRKKFNVKRSQAETIIRTDGTNIINNATVQRYKDAGLTKYEFHAHVDSRTTQTCKDLNKEVFLLENYEPGKNAPPMHYNCRSTIIPDAEEIGMEENDKSSTKAPPDIDKLMSEIDVKTASINDIMGLGREFAKENDILNKLGSKDQLREAFGKYREMGGKIPKDRWFTRSNKIVKSQLEDAFSYYPKDWADLLVKNDRKFFAGKTNRGFFSRELVNSRGNRYLPGAMSGDGVSIYANGIRKTTAYHEIGHLVEYFNDDLLRISKDFIAYRTKNEAPVGLNEIFPGFNYSRNEITKKDNFISPYIGKEYKNASEVLSMGLESLFEPENGHLKGIGADGKYHYSKIDEDPEYLNLILGMILKG